MVYKSGQINSTVCHNSRVWRTDRETNGQMDRILITRTRLHTMQHGKNPIISDSKFLQHDVLALEEHSAHMFKVITH